LATLGTTNSVLAMPSTMDTDGRPHIKGEIEGQKTTFLVDTGACISCISEETFLALPGTWSLEEIPPEPNFRLSSVSGQAIPVLGRYMFDMEVFDRRINRPMYVLAGLRGDKAILGIDFIKEQQLIIDGDEMRWRSELAAICPDANLLLYPAKEYKIDPHTVRRVSLMVRDLAGKTARCGELGVPTSHGPQPSLWDALCSVQEDGSIDAVISNGSEEAVIMPMDQPTGFFDLVDEATIEPLEDKKISEMFGTGTVEPPEPKVGRLSDPDPEMMEFLETNAQGAPSTIHGALAGLSRRHLNRKV